MWAWPLVVVRMAIEVPSSSTATPHRYIQIQYNDFIFMLIGGNFKNEMNYVLAKMQKLSDLLTITVIMMRVMFSFFLYYALLIFS